MPRSREKSLSAGNIAKAIFLIRGQSVMFDADLAALYGVPTKALVQAVGRNRDRFPDDFCFRLTIQEFSNLRSQIVTSSWGGRRTAPYVFTEQGVAMLSSVLRSPRAIVVNIEIMRTFVRLREALIANKELANQLRELESRIDRHLATHDEAIERIFQAIRRLIASPPPPRKRRIGFV
jgi:hypothetical protein